MQAGLTSLLDNSHLTLVLGCDPASSQVYLEDQRPPADSRPARGRVQALSLASAGDQWASVLASFSLTTVLAVFQSAGQDNQPHLGLVYSPSLPRPGDWRTLSLQLLHPMDRFYPGPSLFSVVEGPVLLSVSRASWLPAGSGGQGSVVGLSSISEVK